VIKTRLSFHLLEMIRSFAMIAGVTLVLLSGNALGQTPRPIDMISPPDRHFFSRRFWAGKIPVVAHADVPDAALRAGADRLEKMLARAPRIAANLRARSFELEIAGDSQMISDLPPFQSLKGTILKGEDFDAHTRGGGHLVDHFVACAEGNLLGYVGVRFFQHDVCIHELAHAVMWLGLSPTIRASIFAVFEKSKSKWAGVYAGTDPAEYFAELSMWYFGSSGPQAPVAKTRPGQQWLSSYDPAGFEMLDAIYTDRLAPGSVSLDVAAPHAASDEGTARSIEGKLPATLRLHNATNESLLTYWLDYSGQRRMPEVLPVGADRAFYSYATHAFVVTALDGRARAIYVMGSSDATATVSP
jgi:hypothetical protein